MYLKRLEIQGFKSFANKTILDFLPPKDGVFSLTAIVGPNGSGKSNVSDAIRWVMGETSMKNVRAKKNEDVIFNGSGNRKPVSRASVELLFDNSLGGASGEWSQYAEISVKRVLHRDGGSDYFINNKSTPSPHHVFNNQCNLCNAI